MNNIIKFNAIKQHRRENMVEGNNITYPDISKEKKKQIETLVDSIIAGKVTVDTPSIDIVSLVKQDGFAVQTSEMDLNTTGCLIVNDIETVLDTNKHRLIVVNQEFRNDNNDENVELKKSRFITAHEYGHFKLHKIPGQPIYAHRDTYHRTDPQELEADYFARSILMPYNIFSTFAKAAYEVCNNDSDKIVSLLSMIFKVTKDKTSKRLNDLKELS